eukprot:Hpha_TRINITY_DN27400_c0_g1::TRINITY_DN27400_c0_g1_i1::g.193871::m.193871
MGNVLWGAVLAVVLLFRMWCDVAQFTHHPQKVNIRNERTEDIDLCWLGTLGDVDPWDPKCWPVSRSNQGEFNSHVGHLLMLKAPSGWWTAFSVSPGWNEIKVNDQTAGGWDTVVVTPNAIVRNLHSLGRTPWFPCRMLVPLRWCWQLILWLGCVALALWRRTQGRGTEGRHPSVAKKYDRGEDKKGDRADHPPTTHDLMKLVAFLPMMANHGGRMVFQAGPNTWWYCWSDWTSLAFYFFLTGQASQHPSATSRAAAERQLWLLGGFAVVRCTVNPIHIIGGSVLLLHAVSYALFSVLPPLAKWPLWWHFASCAVMALAAPLLQECLWLDGGGTGLMYAALGAARETGASTLPTVMWLTVVTLVRAAHVFNFQMRPHAMQWGFSSAFLPGLISVVGAPLSVWVLLVYKRRPLVLPPWAAVPLRWTGRHALTLYVGHALAMGIYADYRGFKAPLENS